MSEEVELFRKSRSLPSPTLRELAAMLFRHSRLLAASFLAVFAVILVYGFLVTPRYEAHLKVLLRRGRTDPVVSPQPASGADFARDEITEEELNSEVELLRDEDLLRQVVEDAGLVPGEKTDARRRVRVASAVRDLAHGLSVEPLRKSNLIQVNYRSRDPEEAARMLSLLSAVYLRKHTELQRPSGELRFFEQQTEESGRRLHESEQQLVKFTRANGVASAALERDIALQKLGDAEAEYRQILQERAEASEKITALRQQIATLPPRSITQVRSADNPQLLEKLKTHLLELRFKRTELLTRFEPSYRLVQEVEREIADTRQSIVAEALTPVKDETTDRNPQYEWARMELEKAQVQWEGLQARGAAASSQILSLRSLAQQRQADSVSQLGLARATRAEEDSYFLYLRKREEARIGDALDANRILNVAIVQPPVAPALPVRSALFYFLLAFGVSSVFGVGVVLMAEYFDPTLRTPDEAKALLELPVLAWLPEAENRPANTTTTRLGWRKVVRE
jgi:uncharacterized protein involved in exopolysaccharide biosynthesis